LSSELLINYKQKKKNSMKRIYMTVALLGALVTGAFAQRVTDVEAVWISPDTGVLNTIPCSDSFNLEFLFINRGPETITTADTFFFYAPFTPDGQVNYRVTTAAIPTNDTIVHYRFKYTRGQIQRLADPNDNFADVYPPFANGNYVMYGVVGGFTNAQTPPPNYLREDTTAASESGTAATAIKIDCGTSGIDDVFAGLDRQSLSVYPNPASGYVSFKYDFANHAMATVRVTDISGRVILVKDFGKQSGQKEISVDISSLNNGMYYLELVTDDKRATSKFTVQK
jgi:hypothetical protein